MAQLKQLLPLWPLRSRFAPPLRLLEPRHQRGGQLFVEGEQELDALAVCGLGQNWQATSFLVLIYHGDPVRFRNIWVREFKELEGKAKRP